jgi:hypothetical protein
VGPARHAPAPRPPDGQVFLRVESIDPFEVPAKTFAPKEDVQSAIAEPIDWRMLYSRVLHGGSSERDHGVPT